MSNSVTDFFSKGKIKKFKNSAKAFAERQAVKVAAATMVLAGAFATTSQAQSNDSEDMKKVTTVCAIGEKGDTICTYKAIPNDSVSFDRLQKLVNNSTKSETGRHVLSEMSKQGTVLTMVPVDFNKVAYYERNKNLLVLNEKHENAKLQSFLIHEGKHSIQQSAMEIKLGTNYNFATNVVVLRALEADAMATQVKFSYEMAQAGDSAAWKSLQKVHHGMTETFEKNAKKQVKNKNETMKDAMKETMLSWYDHKEYVKLYDEQLQRFHSKASSNAFFDGPSKYFTNGIDVNNLVQKVFTMNGEKYAGDDGSILLTPRTASINRDIYNSVERNNKRFDIEDQSATVFLYPSTKEGVASTRTFAQEIQLKQIKAKQAAAAKAVAAKAAADKAAAEMDTAKPQRKWVIVKQATAKPQGKRDTSKQDAAEQIATKRKIAYVKRVQSR